MVTLLAHFPESKVLRLAPPGIDARPIINRSNLRTTEVDEKLIIKRREKKIRKMYALIYSDSQLAFFRSISEEGKLSIV